MKLSEIRKGDAYGTPNTVFVGFLTPPTLLDFVDALSPQTIRFGSQWLCQ